MNPFLGSPAEWALLQPLVGESMLELGNKRSGKQGTYKAFFEILGYRHVSVDWNGEDGALQLDLRQPLELGVFDMVTNIGTTEHVSEQLPCWENILNALPVDGVLVSTTPLPGDWPKHGMWYPKPEFFEALADDNCLVLERMWVVGDPPNRLLAARLRRVGLCPPSVPTELIVFNKWGAR